MFCFEHKKYLNISEVSKILQIEEYKIRYWDSIDPKTNRYRIEGISTKSKGGTRYFSKENINKLGKLKKLLYENGENTYPLKLASNVLDKNKKTAKNKLISNDYENNQNNEKIAQILNKMRILLDK